MRQAYYLIGLTILCALLSRAAGPGAAAPPALHAPQSALTTDDSYTVEELVQDIFVNGACNTITNIQQIGDSRGIGYFEQGNSSIGMDRGIVLSTGPIDNAEGPNEVTDRSGNFNDSSGDADLNLLATGDVKDAVGISFDFTPLDSLVTFRYVFASEEYCEFVGSIYNDVFGFFISGPGIQGGFSGNAANVALIPGSQDFVSINSVNFNDNPNYYLHNELSEDAAFCNLNIDEGYFLPEIEYDGFTKKLTAVLNLIPCETYRIRLVVADVGDNFFDSAVFLEAESFNLGGEVELTSDRGYEPGAPAQEGCAGTQFRFTRKEGSPNDFPLQVNFIVSPQSTAAEGEDFAPLPASVTIPAGSESAVLPVEVFNDAQDEPLEFITLLLDIPCACYSDSATVYIEDSENFDFELPDLPICEGSTNELQPLISGGQPPFSYNWSNGSVGPGISLNSSQTGTYSLTVTDACGTSHVDTAMVFASPAPQAYLSGDRIFLCEGDTVYLPVELSGTPPWTLRYQIDGQPQPPLENISSTPFLLPATQPGQYQLQQVIDPGCTGPGIGNRLVIQDPIEISASTTPVSCWAALDGSLSVEINGGVPPFEYEWLNDPEASLMRDSLGAGRYTLIVEDSAGCRKKRSIDLGSPPQLQPIATDCETLQAGIRGLRAQGGTPPYLYSVNNSPYYDSTYFESLEAGTVYQIRIQDANGCQLQQELLMPATYGQGDTLYTEITAKLGVTVQLQPRIDLPENLIASLRWTPTSELSCYDCLNPEIRAVRPATYTLRITDVFGCTVEETVRLLIDETVDVYIPTAFSPNGDKVNDKFAVYANVHQVEEIVFFRVYDRWGGMLYEAKNFTPDNTRAGWDGVTNGYPADPGVYAYSVRLKLASGAYENISGDVMLLR